jgi:hypothetical protein
MEKLNEEKTMAVEAIKIAHSLAEALENNDFDKVMSFLAPDCQWKLVTSGKVYQGHKALRGFLSGGWGGAVERQSEVIAEFGVDNWATFEYVSRGRFSKDAVKFVREIEKQKSPLVRFGRIFLIQLVYFFFKGKHFEIPVCFIYHANDDGLIDQVHEYVAR